MFKKKEITTPYTVARCTSCGKETKSTFSKDDYLFKESECSCGAVMLIEMIYGETSDA